jgi:hypothetical protein
MMLLLCDSSANEYFIASTIKNTLLFAGAALRKPDRQIHSSEAAQHATSKRCPAAA